MQIQPMLRTENLGYRVDEGVLLQGISVRLEREAFVAVVGPSGAGKSTFLRLLNRLDEPTSGTVYLDGQDYREVEPQTLRRRVGMLMQAPNLFPGTVAENLRYGPGQRGERFPVEGIEGLLARVGLPGFAARDVSNLSGGEAQRVSLARTLANEPEVLLLDEPTSALDDAIRGEVEDLIGSLAEEQGLTCLMVTHDMAQARRMASRAVVLKDGRLVAEGPLEEVLDAD